MKMQANHVPACHRWWLVLALSSALLAGCASGPTAQLHDPLEPFNRSMQHLNDSVDEAVLKPVATTYRDHLPSPLRTGVHNFFGNLRDLWSSLNAALQARPREAAENFMRFNVNTFLGFGGVLDIASEMGIERTTLDMGHTLGRWGVPAGPYLVLPLLGPSSVRDATGMVLDRQGDWLSQGVDTESVRNGLTALRVVDTRASLLGASNLLEQAALDKYSFVRDAYLQRRQSQIDAGRPAPKEVDDE